MKILITGIGGLLGGRFAHWVRLNHPDVEIIGVDDFSCGYQDNVPIDLKVHRYTLGDNNMVHHYYDYIFHFAAHAAECLSPFMRVFNYRNNVCGTAEVINMAIQKGTKRLVFTSSIAVYGHGAPPFEEDDFCNTLNDPYGIAKYACEQDIKVACDQHGLDYCILRPHNVYGIGQDLWNPYRNVLGIWFSQIMQGLPLTIFGDGKQMRAMSCIDDNLPCFWRAATEEKASQQIINLGGATPISIDGLCHAVKDATGYSRVEYQEARHEVKNAWCSVDKSKELLGYQENTELEAGIEEMWNWAKGVWNRREINISYKDQYEITKGMYGCWR